MYCRMNPSMLDWLQSLSAAGMKTAILSNMQADMIRHARENFPWLDWLTWTTLSAEVRSIKPEPAIYEHCLQGLGVAAAESLFIDDREVNVLAAQSLGIHAIQYGSLDRLRNDLQSAEFSILPKEHSGAECGIKSERFRSTASASNGSRIIKGCDDFQPKVRQCDVFH